MSEEGGRRRSSGGTEQSAQQTDIEGVPINESESQLPPADKFSKSKKRHGLTICLVSVGLATLVVILTFVTDWVSASWNIVGGEFTIGMNPTRTSLTMSCEGSTDKSRCEFWLEKKGNQGHMMAVESVCRGYGIMSPYYQSSGEYDSSCAAIASASHKSYVAEGLVLFGELLLFGGITYQSYYSLFHTAGQGAVRAPKWYSKAGLSISAVALVLIFSGAGVMGSVKEPLSKAFITASIAPSKGPSFCWGYWVVIVAAILYVLLMAANVMRGRRALKAWNNSIANDLLGVDADQEELEKLVNENGVAEEEERAEAPKTELEAEA